MKQDKGKKNKAFETFIRKTGMTQKQLAEAIGVIPATVNGWLFNRYKPSAYTMSKMARQFGVPFGELEDIFFGGDEE